MGVGEGVTGVGVYVAVGGISVKVGTLVPTWASAQPASAAISVPASTQAHELTR